MNDLGCRLNKYATFQLVLEILISIRKSVSTHFSQTGLKFTIIWPCEYNKRLILSKTRLGNLFAHL